jgi:nucleoside phosphorylase
MMLNVRDGLNALREYTRGKDWFSTFETLATALLETLQRESLFGYSPQINSDQNFLIFQLNDLTLKHSLPVTFSELCENPSALLALAKEESSVPSSPPSSEELKFVLREQTTYYGTQQRWAILVGVGEYEDVSAYGRLDLCDHDVRAIRQQLLASGFQDDHIVLLTDNETGNRVPKRENILAVLQSLSQITEEDDVLLFYFSGHGATKNGESYLIPRNGRQVVLHDTAVPMRRVKEIMNTAQARAKVVILDACHSGTNSHSKASEPMSADFIQQVFEKATGFAIYSSCQQEQLSYVWKEKNCSVFTYYVLEALKGKADTENKGLVTVNDLSKYVTYHVKLWASNRQLSQIPLLNYCVSGDIILVRYTQQQNAPEQQSPEHADHPVLDEDETAGLRPEELAKLDQYVGGLEALRQGSVHYNLTKQVETFGAKPKNQEFTTPEDLVAGYKKAPLHAAFLYTSEDSEVETYIKEHWAALDSQSGNSCDIYIFVDQFLNKENGYDLMTSLDVIRECGFDNSAELPGLFFWDDQHACEFIPFGLRLDHTTIKAIVRPLFATLKHDPTIAAVKRFKRESIQNSYSAKTSQSTNLPKPSPLNYKPDWQSVDIGIIIPLQEEFETFRFVMQTTYQSKVDIQSGRSFFLFQYPCPTTGRPYTCAVGFIGQAGQNGAILFTEKMLAFCNPQNLVMLGMAGGIHPDVSLGDVIVARSVDSYMDQAKGEPSTQPGTFSLQFSGEVYLCSPSLLSFIEAFQFAHPDAYQQWLQASSLYLQQQLTKETYAFFAKGGQLKSAPLLRCGPLASGPIVSASTAFKKQLHARNRAFLAVEMEAGGMMYALHRTKTPKNSLVLRGISDFGDEVKNEVEQITGKALRSYAMYNATQLFQQLLLVGAFPHHEENTFKPPISPASHTSSFSEHAPLMDDFNKLYHLLRRYITPLELREICRAVDIGYNSLNDASHDDRAFSLTTLLDNQNRLDDLENELRRRLPRRFEE